MPATLMIPQRPHNNLIRDRDFNPDLVDLRNRVDIRVLQHVGKFDSDLTVEEGKSREQRHFLSRLMIVSQCRDSLHRDWSIFQQYRRNKQLKLNPQWRDLFEDIMKGNDVQGMPLHFGRGDIT